MREVKTKQIGEFQYRVKQLSDPAGMRLFTRLMKILIPAIGAGLKGVPSDGQNIKIAEMTTGAVGDAIIAMAHEMTEDDFMYLYDTLATDSQFSQDGQAWFPMTSDSTHWSGRYLQKFQWMAFALEVNYADFLGGNDAIGRLVQMFRTGRQSSSPNISTGVPNAS